MTMMRAMCEGVVWGVFVVCVVVLAMHEPTHVWWRVGAYVVGAWAVLALVAFHVRDHDHAGHAAEDERETARPHHVRSSRTRDT